MTHHDKKGTNAPDPHHDKTSDAAAQTRKTKDSESKLIFEYSKKSEEALDKALEDSFPASDPPAFNHITGAGCK